MDIQGKDQFSGDGPTAGEIGEEIKNAMKAERNEEKIEEATQSEEKSQPVQPTPLEIKIIKNAKREGHVLTTNQDAMFQMIRRNQMNQMVLDKKLGALAPMMEAVMQNQMALEKKMLWIMQALGAELPESVTSEMEGIKKKSTIIGAEPKPIIGK